MSQLLEKPQIHFSLYPPIGGQDFRYTYATARVRSLMSGMLSLGLMSDIANASDYESAVSLFGGTDYALSGAGEFSQVQEMLLKRRNEVRKLFKDLARDEQLVVLMKARVDFVNLKHALRMKLLDKPVGTDYSEQGSVDVETFSRAVEEERYDLLPEHMREGIERGVLAYYKNKDIRQIDYGIDQMHFEFRLEQAKNLESVFLIELYRMWIDITNLSMMLRLKFTGSQQRDIFFEGGYLDIKKLIHGVDVGYESIPALFETTPYYNMLNIGVNYLNSNNSFLKFECESQRHVNNYLRMTRYITAGPQPLVAYLLMKEDEIRMVRLLLTAKKDRLNPRLILDRLGK